MGLFRLLKIIYIIIFVVNVSHVMGYQLDGDTNFVCANIFITHLHVFISLVVPLRSLCVANLPTDIQLEDMQQRMLIVTHQIGYYNLL